MLLENENAILEAFNQVIEVERELRKDNENEWEPRVSRTFSGPGQTWRIWDSETGSVVCDGVTVTQENAFHFVVQGDDAVVAAVDEHGARGLETWTLGVTCGASGTFLLGAPERIHVDNNKCVRFVYETVYVLFDLETTGLTAPVDILQVCFAVVREQASDVALFSRYVTPTRVDVETIADNHVSGITAEKIRSEGHDIHEVWSDLLVFLGDGADWTGVDGDTRILPPCLFFAHNGFLYDYPILMETLARRGLAWAPYWTCHDSLDLARKVIFADTVAVEACTMRTVASFRLIDLFDKAKCDVELDGDVANTVSSSAHDARSDVVMMWVVLVALGRAVFPGRSVFSSLGELCTLPYPQWNRNQPVGSGLSRYHRARAHKPFPVPNIGDARWKSIRTRCGLLYPSDFWIEYFRHGSIDDLADQALVGCHQKEEIVDALAKWIRGLKIL